MTPEERKRLADLQAKFGPAPSAVAEQPAVAADGDAARLAELEAKFGPAPAAASTAPTAAAESGAPEPTLGEQIAHVAKGPGTQVVGMLDMPYYLKQAGRAIGEYIPEGVKRSAGAAFDTVNPVRPVLQALDMAGAELPAYATGDAPVTDLPGLRQAKELLASEEANVPQGSLADNARTFTEWAGPGMLFKATRNILEEGVKRAPQNLTRALDDTAIDAAMGAGATAGSAGLGYLSDDAAWIGELGGGLAGLGLALATGRTTGLDKNQKAVLKALNDMYDDPQQALAELRRRTDAGEVGTIGDLTREGGIFDVENWAGKATPAGRRAAGQTADARIRQIYDDVTEPMRTGVPAERAALGAERAIDNEFQVAEGAARRATGALNDEVAQANAAARQATEEAQRAVTRQADVAQAVDPGAAPYDLSRKLSDEYSDAAKAFDEAEVRPAWKAFEDGSVDVVAIQSDLRMLEDALRPAQQESLTKHYGSLMKELRELDGNATPADVQGVISDMKAAVNDGFSGNSNVPTRVTKVLDDITKSLEANLAEVNPAYGNAVAKTRQLYERFSPSDVGQARKAAEPEVLAQKLGLSGDQGAVTARLVAAAETPSLQPIVADYIRAQAVRTPNIGDAFLTKYEAALDGLPADTRADIVRMVQARQAAETADTAAQRAAKEADTVSARAEREAAQIQRNLETQEKGLRGDIRGRYAESPNKTIDSLLNNPDGATELKALMDEIVDIDQVDAFKANIGERLENMLFKTTRDVDSGVVNSIDARAKAYEDFIAMKDNLVAAGVLDQAAADGIEAAIERTNTAGLRKASRAYDITRQADEHINLLSSGGAAAILGPMPGAYSLMVGGAIRRSLNTLLRGKLMAKRIDALSDYLNNPKKYLADLDKLEGPEEVQREFLTRLVGATQAARLMAGDEE
jgi:hypothetical protein